MPAAIKSPASRDEKRLSVRTTPSATTFTAGAICPKERPPNRFVHPHSIERLHQHIDERPQSRILRCRSGARRMIAKNGV